MNSIEKLKNKIEELKEKASRCYKMRASFGRGYKATTDQLLEDARNLEIQIRELQKIVDEMEVK